LRDTSRTDDSRPKQLSIGVPRSRRVRAAAALPAAKPNAQNRAHARDSVRPALAPFRLTPNVYVAQTQPGFEAVAWEEIAAAYANRATRPATAQQDERGRTSHIHDLAPTVVRELARRSVPERAGMSIFHASRPEPLRALRTVEDLFAVIDYRPVLDGRTALERITAGVRATPLVAQALATRNRLEPGLRSGHRLRYRVVARMMGEHEFRRIDLARAVERGIAERGDHSWRLSPDEADVEFWATLFADEFLLAMRLSGERLRHREYKVAHLPGSLRPSVAAALGWLSRPAPDDIVLDPFCGTGTILIERAHLGRYRHLIGCDREAQALAAARENVGPRYQPLELHPWDALAIPLPDRSVSKIITNLPWGLRHGSHEENRRVYPRVFAELRRVVQPGGRIVVLTGETRLMSGLAMRHQFRPDKVLHASILGAHAAAYVCDVPD
jgi:tRNA (guanine6-N2)-methyltransferase